MTMSGMPMAPLIVTAFFLTLFSAVQSGTWLSFNQNTGGMDLADRLLGSPSRGKSIADVVASGELGPEENLQLAGLLRMCKERVKRSLRPRNMEQLNDLCSVLIQLGEQQKQPAVRGKRTSRLPAMSRFVPIQLDEEPLWL